MRFLIRLSRKKQPAAIAILAILMLFIAPEVSRTLEHWRLAQPHVIAAHHAALSSEAMHSDDMPGMDMSGTAHEAMASSSAEHNVGHPTTMAGMPGMMSGGNMLDDIACGYCLVLTHLPLMLWIFTAIVWLTLRASISPPPRQVISFFPLYFPGLVQPRAPPYYA
ncbi:DUF2946 domain-containing protein [Candidatus Pantoea multigeneris]|uniref:DUF2946 domain-containing protein n=1 Tax=Candidatus Pantoea multigeneris TaxID=2608357 RepID=A0ABX0REA9_9GAMM|nr:DUF2946 domain-containing protein [Pantoea multigeneris]